MTHETTESQNINILAKTIYGEARGEYYRIDGGLTALVAVANVVKNRLKHPEKYGRSIMDICLRPYQFSCWNVNDPNYVVLQNINTEHDYIFKVATEVAKGVLESDWPDLTHEANHYHTRTMKKYPAWAQGRKPVRVIGNHLFYKL